MTDTNTLRDIQHSKRGLYEVRTRHKDETGEPRYINQLICEQSPYLLQHAHNPVNWHSWCDATFAKARVENKPVFLSIGYSTCHWCHVMEEESFDNENVAAVINQHFIPVKVDREQRPDLDEIYMTAVQMVSGHGGWPMSAFLTPEGQPFYGGTYFPAHQFVNLLNRIGQLWQTEQTNLLEQGRRLEEAISQHLSPTTVPDIISPDLPEAVNQQLIQMSDQQFGGVGDAPKFPQEANLLYLLDQISRSHKPLSNIPAWAVVKKALDSMLQGGIYDQLGGGFHRYSVDRYWLVPHFEKMLYNQGQLIRVFNKAWQLSGNPEYQRIICETADYVLREMRSDEGLFYSATDADSEGEEGKFFVWSEPELRALLTIDEFELVKTIYGITTGGNFEGANILFLPEPLTKAASQLNTEYTALVTRLTGIKAKLYPVRQRRIHPLTDDKVITEWNGMIIAALAEAGRLLGRPDYIQGAVDAAEQLWSMQRQPDGRLWRLSMDNQGSDQALLEDYAHLMEGLLQIYDATREHIFLERCQALLTHLEQDYWDHQQGGFFVSRQISSGPLLVRSKNLGDNATICGNSQILSVLTGLWQRTGDIHIQKLCQQQVAAFSDTLRKFPLSALMFLKGVADAEAPGPTGIQYSGDGQISAEITRAESSTDNILEITLQIRMSEGWHIQSHQQKDRKGEHTDLRLLSETEQQVLDIHYPVPVSWNQADGSEIEIYNDTCDISITLKCHSKAPVRLALLVQACNEDRCHQPRQLELVHWLKS